MSLGLNASGMLSVKCVFMVNVPFLTLLYVQRILKMTWRESTEELAAGSFGKSFFFSTHSPEAFRVALISSFMR